MSATPTLRLTQTTQLGGDHGIQVGLTGLGAPQSAFSQFAFTLAEQDREDLRWYLEDYLQYPIDPAPVIAARVEQRMRALGGELYAHLFDSNPAVRRLWARLEGELPNTRVEIASEVDADTVLPWELLHDPHSNTDLAVHARSFVRIQRQTARAPTLPEVGAGEAIRVLLVICRPGGRQDVPFRSVASHLVRMSAQAREVFRLEVLRPPTFGQLARVLRQAASRGQPYHVVHFDGHGTWRQLDHPTGGAADRWNPLRYAGQDSRPGPHGYLLFEHPEITDNYEYVDGMRLGNLLAEAGVPVLVLNACQSAHAELATAPQDAAAAPTDVQTRVRAYGSLAQEVVDAGVAGVVAMRYSVYVVTAAQFIADLYAALLEGLPLGEAVTMGRKQLAAQPDREIAFTPRPLQDWVVPVVYESSPLTLFPKPSVGEQLRISVDPVQAGRERTGLAAGLPGSPDVGFYGRDETLLALDRAFDSHRVVLLHAFAGAGKTSTAVEFARWYQLTDGLQGPVLFTSFAQHTPLTRLLDQLGATFEQSLEQAGVHWFALDEPQRRQVALQLLEQMPVLWIWDNVEPIAGFPIGAPTAWSNDEQEELADFLRAIRDTKARVLLTSRRDERGWLGDLPRRVTLPPMPLAERVQLARAIADKHSRRLGDVDDWRPLLDYTHGNPLTITVLVGQALRDGLRTRAEVQEFVSCIQAGEATLADDEDAGRTRSLGASLKYGFQHGFTEPERSQLALLHLFQGAVTVQALCAMGDAELVGEPVAAVCGLDRQAGIALLDRAAEVGLLIAYRNGYYGIHPALPWYFRDLFTQAYGPANSPTALQTVRAYATAFHDLGNHFHRQYAHGQDRLDVIRTLEAEEGNLLHACHLAGKHGWWEQLLGSMQGLRTLYEHAKRSVEWARLVDEVASDLIDPATDQPLPGCEEHWGMITDYRVELATRQRDYNTAERLARQLVVWNREWAAAALATLPTALDDKQKNELHNLGSALHRLGEVLRKQGQPACTEAYREQLELDRRIGNRSAEATAAHNLGKAHSEIPELYDLDTAAYWYQYSLDLHDLGDDLGRARCLNQLGSVHLRQFLDARHAGRPQAELLTHLNAVLRTCHQVLDLVPPDAVGDLAVTHTLLGHVYQEVDQFDTAVSHWRESIRHYEASENRYDAAYSRFSVAVAFASRGRFEDALLWAQAALRDYQTYGNRASAEIMSTQQFIAQVHQDMSLGGA